MEWNGMEWRQSGENQQRCRKLSCIPSSAYQSSTSTFICFSGISTAKQPYTVSRTSAELCHTFIHFLHVYVFFSVTKKPLFGLQACVGNYQKITNTNATANNPPIYKNKGRHYFCNAIIITVYSIRRIRTSIAK